MESNQIPTADPGTGPMGKSEIIGCENPKIIEWEELQQELARLWSLSSAIKKAKERKESLAGRLDSVIQVRQKYLQQSNELDGMRRKLEAKKLAMGETAMQMKETMEDVKFKMEQLGTALRSLLVAGKKVCAAQQQLQKIVILSPASIANPSPLLMIATVDD